MHPRGRVGVHVEVEDPALPDRAPQGGWVPVVCRCSVPSIDSDPKGVELKLQKVIASQRLLLIVI